MSRREKNVEKQSNRTFRKILIIAIFLLGIVCTLKYAYNYIRDDVTDKINLVINNSNVTTSLKKDVIKENGVVYLSKEDISNFFDSHIYYDQKYNQIITGSENRIAAIVIGEKKMTNNGSNVDISATVIQKDGTYYIPFSEMSQIYNVKITYIDKSNTVIIESLDRELIVADSNRNNSVKAKPTAISRTVDKIKRGDNIVIISKEKESESNWIKVRTDNGKIGYVKKNTVANQVKLRDAMTVSKQINGNISMIWDYIHEDYGSAPSRTGKIEGVNVVSPTFFTLKRLGKGEVKENVGTSGKAYIEWAHNNGYKVWPSLSNSSQIETTSEIMNDYKLRQELINKIVSFIVKYNLDGINIDFENMYQKDKDLFSRFIIELAPRLKEIGAVLSVDVTAPDGSETWSMCYDRHTIGKIADYVVFMAYDQHGDSSTEEGSNAGYDWIEVNLNKFVGTQEEVDSSKIILAVPFYTRSWYRNANGELRNKTLNMDNKEIPSNVSKVWDDNTKQYVAEYTKNGRKYKVWIEDERSIKEKLLLIDKYHLAGAAYWQKGMEPSSIWSMISDTLDV